MNQVEKNKEELREMMAELGNAPLTKCSISNLGTLMHAYKALCMISGEGHTEGHAEPAKAHPKAPAT